MANKLETIATHVLALDDDEIELIVDALRDYGRLNGIVGAVYLADEIKDEVCGGCDCDADEGGHEIATLGINIDTSQAMREIDAFQSMINDAIRSINKAREHGVIV